MNEDKTSSHHTNETMARTRGWLNRTVVGAGATSALGDFCYETTTVVLPSFLAVLGLPASVLGTIEGVADAVSSFAKMISGYVANKFGHRKSLVLMGYAFTPLGQVLIHWRSDGPCYCSVALFPGLEGDCAGHCVMRL